MENTINSLRPLRLGEILDQAVRLYRRNFIAFIGIIALIHIPLSLIQMGLSYLMTTGMNPASTDPFEMFSPGYFIGIFGSMLMGAVQFILLQGIATGALTQAMTSSYLFNRPLGIIEAYQQIRNSLGRLVLSMVVMLAIAFGLSILTVIIPIVGWLVGPGLLIFLFTMVNPLIAPVVVFEKQEVLENLRRAWDLARRRFWWLLGFVFILNLFAQLVITGPAMVLNYVLLLLISPELSLDPNLLTTLATALVSLTLGLVYVPLQMTAQSLVYFDLRVRTEGFDLALLSLQNTGTQPDLESIRSLPPQPPSEKLATWTDIGNFTVVTVVIVGLYVLLVALAMLFIFGTAGLFF